MKIILIGSGDAGFECAKKLSGDVLWISKNNYMTKKWVMPSLLASYTEKKKNKLIVDIPRYIEKNNMDANFIIDAIEGIDTKKKLLLGSKENYEYDKLVIATGSLPKMPTIGIKDKKIMTFDTYSDFMAVQQKLEKAKRVSIVGSGPIGFELSLRLSSKYEVSLIEQDNDVLMSLLIDRPLYRYMVRKILKLRGVKLHLSTSACSAKEDYMYCKTLDGDEFFIDFDAMIFATGIRQNVPMIDGEDFHKERVLFCNDFGEAFIHQRGGVRKKLKDMYAIGDATCYLTKRNYPASAIFAEKSARIAAFNIMKGNKKKIRFHPPLYYKFIDTILRRTLG